MPPCMPPCVCKRVYNLPICLPVCVGGYPSLSVRKARSWAQCPAPSSRFTVGRYFLLPWFINLNVRKALPGPWAACFHHPFHCWTTLSYVTDYHLSVNNEQDRPIYRGATVMLAITRFTVGWELRWELMTTFWTGIPEFTNRLKDTRLANDYWTNG